MEIPSKAAKTQGLKGILSSKTVKDRIILFYFGQVKEGGQTYLFPRVKSLFPVFIIEIEKDRIFSNPIFLKTDIIIKDFAYHKFKQLYKLILSQQYFSVLPILACLKNLFYISFSC